MADKELIASDIARVMQMNLPGMANQQKKFRVEDRGATKCWPT